VDQKSRGEPQATRRNAVPLAFPLPAISNLEKSTVLIHRVRCEEGSDFQPLESLTLCAGLEDFAEQRVPVSLEFAGRLLHGAFLCDSTIIGAPRRRYVSKRAFQLAGGSRGRIIANGRHSSRSLYGYSGVGWEYNRHIINIAYRPTPRFFWVSLPQHVFGTRQCFGRFSKDFRDFRPKHTIKTARPLDREAQR